MFSALVCMYGWVRTLCMCMCVRVCVCMLCLDALVLEEECHGTRQDQCQDPKWAGALKLGLSKWTEDADPQSDTDSAVRLS